MLRFLRVWIALWCVALCVATPMVAASDGPTVRITEVEYSGAGNVSTASPDLFLWRSATHRFTVTIVTTSMVQGEMCLVSGLSGKRATHDLACRSTTVYGNKTARQSINLDQWPAELNGSQTVTVVMRSTNGSTILSRRGFGVTVIRSGGDFDGDGLVNSREVSLGSELQTPDTDHDGLTDGVEVRTYETAPTNNDTDGDGISDSDEVQVTGSDPRSVDTEQDGLADAREVALGTNPTRSDSDGDGLDDGAEVNVHGTDPRDPDTDGDGLDDEAEIHRYETNPLAADTDGDELNDNLEVNTYETDPTRIDTDSDGLEDGLEVHALQIDPARADSDGDGLTDGQEVNTLGTKPTAPDTDGDGLTDGQELNRYGTNPKSIDTDGDGTSDDLEVDERRGPRQTVIGWVLVGLGGLFVVAGLFRRLGMLSMEWSIGTGETSTEVSPPNDIESSHPPTKMQSPTSESIPPEFLGNEQRVLQLLDGHGGRMEQTSIVEETEWSKSKVSRVLTSMEEDGQIVKIDVGRGNLIAHPGEVPRGALTPFEDD